MLAQYFKTPVKQAMPDYWWILNNQNQNNSQKRRIQLIKRFLSVGRAEQQLLGKGFASAFLRFLEDQKLLSD